VLALACAGERAEPSRPPPSPSPSPSPLAPPAPAPSPAPPAPPAAVEPDAGHAGPGAAMLDASPPPAAVVDRERCPLFSPTGGSQAWRAVPELTGLDESELFACYGSPVEAKGARRLYFFPRGCSDRRSELELTVQSGRVTRARVRARITGEHCLDMQ
jgi:hypothetical protein